MSLHSDLDKWIDRISRLALIKIEPNGRGRLLKDLMRILEFFEEIRKLKLEGVDPLFHVVEHGGKLRDDVESQALDLKDVLMNVKEHEEGFVKGPKTV